MRDRKPFRGKPPASAGQKSGSRGGGFRPGGRPRGRPSHDDGDGPTLIYGWHSARAALDNPRRTILRILVTENALHRLQEEGVPLPLAPDVVRQEEFGRRLSADAVHQGILIEAEPLDSLDVEDLPAQGVVLVLDQVTDPHNVGAILRSAAAFAVEALMMTARHSPQATGVLAKAASGALDHVPIVTVGNLARGLSELKERGYLVVGLDSEGEADLAAIPLRAPVAVVLGAEGKGLRQLTRTSCDHVARLDLPGRIKSLNVSNAAALALYVATTRIKGGQP